MLVGDECAIAVQIARDMDKAEGVGDLVIAMRKIIRIA